MRAIKHTLTERFYTWEDAVEVAKSDPELNLEGGEGQVYTPSTYEEEIAPEESWEEPAKSAATSTSEVARSEGENAKMEKEPVR